jgi:uncharacterized repeat protein (TIGR01451 family)
MASSYSRSLAPLTAMRHIAKPFSYLALSLLLAAPNGWLWTPIARADKALVDGSAVCATPGNDGNFSGGGQVNTFYPGTATSAAAGATSIVVGAAIGTPPIKKGDLLLVIQMQGADINATNTNSYGDGSAANNPSQGAVDYPAGGVVNGSTSSTAGNFEYVVATSDVPVAGGTVTLSTPLVNTYANANATATQGQRRFQVIRVPQYANATVTGTITAPDWNGFSGGVVAMDVAGSLTISGSINADGKGFRGGGGRQLGGGSGSNTDVVTLSSNNANGSKGEGIAGTPKYLFDSVNSSLISNLDEGYPNGSYGRGAPGNAGGGGTDGNPAANDQNAGGGGGGNGGLGGKGGRTWSSALPYGGDGGAIFSASASRLALGGGGGAGSTNNGTGTPASGLASSGASGGGIVIVRSGSVSGSGTISANGTKPAPIALNDASGGGGAGGSILIVSDAGTTTGLTLTARGGDGGTNTGGGAPHGPGGGGGGGVIYNSPGAGTSITGGNPGTTNNNATNFGGATAGIGVISPVSTTPADTVTSIAGANCLIKTTKSTTTPTSAAGGIATYTITATNPTGLKRPEARNVTISDLGLPTGFAHTATAITPVYSTGATGPATVTSTGTTSAPSWSGFSIPPGGSVSLTFTVNIAAGTTSGTYQNSAKADTNYINTNAGGLTVAPGALTSIYDGILSGNTAEDVTILPASPLVVDKTVALFTDRDSSGTTIPTPGDILEYTIVTTNPTATAIGGIVLKDNIPANTTYVPNSLQITAGANTGAKTDATGDDQGELSSNQVVIRLGTGANGTAGGSLNNSASTVKFRVQINDPLLPAGTTQLSNQAIVSSTSYGDKPSNDPTTPTLNDPTLTNLGPRLRLVKRITGIKRPSSAVVSIGGYNDLATDVNDNASAWPGGSSAYLLGAINTSQVPAIPGPPAPNDEVEYTIYFLSDGSRAANQVNLCDFIPANQTVVPGTIQLNTAGTLTAIADGGGTGPGSGSYSATATFPTSCTGTNNARGAIYVQVGNLPAASVTPASAYGFFRFRAKVN